MQPFVSIVLIVTRLRNWFNIKFTAMQKHESDSFRGRRGGLSHFHALSTKSGPKEIKHLQMMHSSTSQALKSMFQASELAK